MKSIIAVLGVVTLCSSCNMTKNNQLTDGRWRGEFTYQNCSAPFVFEVANAKTDSTTVTLVNGSERVPLKGIAYSGDTVVIPIEAYDAVLKGVIKDGLLEGAFIKNYKVGDKGIHFAAQQTNAPRFGVVDSACEFSPEGKWDINFINPNDSSKDVGIFHLKDGIVTGSILSTTGDFRYLEGAMTKDGFELSAFAGSSPYLFNIKFMDKDHFKGEFCGIGGTSNFVATRNDKAALADPFMMTQMVKGKTKLGFRLKDVNGKEVSLSDAKFKDKVVIVSLGGSWCPNCNDEMNFLSPWYDANRNRGVEVLEVAFERKDDPEYVTKILSKMIARHSIHYDVLFAGKVNEETKSKVFPELVKINAFPTTIFIDKKGVVRKIHTGFSGPATGFFYDDFKKEFNQVVDELLKE